MMQKRAYLFSIGLSVWLLCSWAVPHGPQSPSDDGDELVLSAIEQDFLESEGSKRDALWESLSEDLTRSRLQQLLGHRAQSNVQAIAGAKEIKRLQRLADERRELDQARKRALNLIFDEKLYFYPYRPPAVSSKRAAQYPEVQRQVGQLVQKVRDVWESRRKVKLGPKYREALKDLDWVQAEADLDRYLLPDLKQWLGDTPEWALWQSAELKQITLADFAKTPEDAERLRRNVRVRALNELNWKADEREWGGDYLLPAVAAHQEQVRVTNDYRLLMGHPALVWNPRLQRATAGHSDYMSHWGILTHVEEKNPEGYDLSKRTRAVEYLFGAGENCSVGRADPKGALDGWFSSSGHHRNMLNPRHTEMASALSGGYWTQNFGTRNFDTADWKP